VTVGAALEAQVRAGGADAQIVDLQPIAPRGQPRPHDVEPLCERRRCSRNTRPCLSTTASTVLGIFAGSGCVRIRLGH